MCFWFEFPWWLMMLDFFHMSVSHLCVFFGEISVHVFYLFLDWIICFFGCWVREVLYLDCGYQTFIWYVICKYLFSFCRVPFSFVDCFLCCAEAFYLDEVPKAHFCFYPPLPLEMCHEKGCCGRCRRGCCLCSPLGFWWIPVSHRGLSSIWSLFVCIVTFVGIWIF